ncbi:LysR family transcriptional regulator [Ramlibacter sp. AW1]|uniref:LysR family transcriptional regulator n=1 Tax=Ramlibacter aurantiacus TaxID=2801330 RepID=A0A936ZR30_9BURK|nr:LysR substrate-binding domain-containing protein [Ramlibacter aurantiacus]MBL0421923.1 LysR family transcriptional regulator [Ramlibacter aurantiacus]
MKLNALRDFLAVAERGSVRAAARQLRLSQPAMTRSIQELEKELGAELFERRTRGVALTPMGEVFLRRAQALRSEMRRAQDEIDQLKGKLHGHLRICLSSGAHMALLPQALRPFRQRYPDVTLEIIDAVLPRIERELLDGTLDLYIGPSYDDVSTELTVEKLFDNQRVVLARKGHPLAGATSLAQLVGAEWVTTSVTHRAEDELSPVFERLGLPAPRMVVQGHSALTFFLSVAYSDLLMMLPVQWLQSPPFNSLLVRVPVREPLWAPPICIVRRSGLPLTPAGEYFCDMTRRAAAHQEALAVAALRA